MDVTTIAKNIYAKEGIYYSKNISKISYPEDGNMGCFQLEDSSYWFNHRNNSIIELVKKFSENQDFFDIGGGNGYFVSMLEKQGYNAVLVEPGLQGCLNAKKRNVTTIINSTLSDAGFEKESIVNIGLFDVIEHIEDHENFIKENYSYLKKGGKVFITVPAFQTLFSEEDVYAGHYRRYTLKTMTELLEKTGFKIKYKTYFFTFIPIPLFLLNSIPFRLGIMKKHNDKDYAKRHKVSNGLISKILNMFLNYEIQKLKKLKKMYIGSSCLFVAEKQ